jgi:tRNA nucleotidyltransferase (CCA-adding enzyme)
MHDLGKGTTPANVLPRHIGHEGAASSCCKRCASACACRPSGKELAEVVAREHGNIHRSADLNAEALLRLLERCDAIRQPERFERVLQACECDARGRLGFKDAAYPQAARLLKAQQAALSVETAPIAQAAAAQGLKGPKLVHRSPWPESKQSALLCRSGL